MYCQTNTLSFHLWWDDHFPSTISAYFFPSFLPIFAASNKSCLNDNTYKRYQAWLQYKTVFKLKWISQTVTWIQITTVMSKEHNKKGEVEIKGTMKVWSAFSIQCICVAFMILYVKTTSLMSRNNRESFGNENRQDQSMKI